MDRIYTLPRDEKALFREATAQGWLAALLDYPYPKSERRMIAAATVAANRFDRIRASNLREAQRLYFLAWANAYYFVSHTPGQINTLHAAHFQGMARSEAISEIMESFENMASVMDGMYRMVKANRGFVSTA